MFGFRVGASDSDADGYLQFGGTPFDLEGASIGAVSDGAEAELTLRAWSGVRPGNKIAGSLDPATGGVCGRSPQVRDWIVGNAPRALGNVTDCSDVTSRHLQNIFRASDTITGVVSLNGQPHRAGDVRLQRR